MKEHNMVVRVDEKLKKDFDKQAQDNKLTSSGLLRQLMIEECYNKKESITTLYTHINAKFNDVSEKFNDVSEKFKALSKVYACMYENQILNQLLLLGLAEILKPKMSLEIQKQAKKVREDLYVIRDLLKELKGGESAE